MASTPSNSNEKDAKTELRGSVLDVLRELLEDAPNADAVLAVVAKLVSRNEELERLLASMRGGKNKSEKIKVAQLDIFLDQLKKQVEGELADANHELEKVAKAHGARRATVKPPKQPPVRRPAPPGLRRVHNPIRVPDSERPCPSCGTERKCVAHETTPTIDLIPAEVIVRLDQREVLACPKCDAEVMRSPQGDKVVTGGAYGANLVAHLVNGKYRLGLPLNRLKEDLQGLGLSMPSSSMSDQIGWATDLMQPLWRCLMAEVLAAKVLHVDGTGIPVRDRASEKGIITGTLWGYVGDQSSAVYIYTSTGKKVGQREGEIGPEEFLSLRKGPICADAANILDATFKSGDRIEVGCNMHARRYFTKALDAGDARAAVPLTAFQTLYTVESNAKGGTPEDLLKERTERSKPVYQQLLEWCRKHQPFEPPNSLLGRAVNYLINHRVALMRFLDDPFLPIDNGIVERLHRRPAVGRRNYLFAGSHTGAVRGAIAYSVLGTCALVGVDPREYLADVLARLARGPIATTDVPALLPAAWKAARDAAAAPNQ